MLRRVIVNGIHYIVRVENGAGTCYYGLDMQTGAFVYGGLYDAITLDVRRAEALAEIGRGKRLA